MAKYKVKVIAHQLKNNIIAKCGDVVDETQLNGNAGQLVKDGFIELVKVEGKKDQKDLKDIEVKSEKVTSKK